MARCRTGLIVLALTAVSIATPLPSRPAAANDAAGHEIATLETLVGETSRAYEEDATGPSFFTLTKTIFDLDRAIALAQHCAPSAPQ